VPFRRTLSCTLPTKELDLSVNFCSISVDLLLSLGVDLDSKQKYDAQRFDESSPFDIGEENFNILLYQEAIGRPGTGVWIEDDELAYAKYRDEQNWKIIVKVIDAPKSWDMGIRPDDILLNLEF